MYYEAGCRDATISLGLTKQAGVRDALRVALTGKVPVFHGTSKLRVPQILSEGIRPGAGGGVSELIPHVNALNTNLGFGTLNRGSAQQYAAQQAGIGRSKKLMDFWSENKLPGHEYFDRKLSELTGMPGPAGDMSVGQLTRLHSGRMLGVLPGGKQVLEARIPRGELAKHEVLNPEAAALHKQIQTNLVPAMAPRHADLYGKVLAGTAFGGDVVMKGGIPSKYIVGSPSYQSTGAQQLASHWQDVKNNPGAVGKDVIRSLLGIRHSPDTLVGV